MVLLGRVKNALKFGYRVKILRGYSFKKGKIFKGWVDDQYKLRTSYPKSHPMNFIAKILLNSLYGRFGMTDYYPEIEFLTKSEFKELPLSDKIEEVLQFKDKYLVKWQPEQTLEEELGSTAEMSNVNIAISSAVTAYARIEMAKYKHPDFLKKLGLNLYFLNYSFLFYFI